MRFSRAGSGFRAMLGAGLLVLLAACQGAPGAGPAAKATPDPDYVTYTDHFAALQKAGLNGNYASFVGHLKPADPAPLLADLQRSFRGKPFDVYTRRAATGPSDHRRFVELRSTDGRLYLFLKLDKVPGGWAIAEYDLGRNEAAISAKL